MVTETYIIVAAFILGAFFFLWRNVIKTYQRFRGKMLVMCPETHQATGVEVDERHAALSTAHGGPDLRLKACTRWPEHENCGQGCLNQIELSPDGCLVRTMLTDWYQGKSCISCGREFPKIDSYDHKAVFGYDKKPALRSPEGAIVEWLEVPVETLPEVLSTHKPVCWNCLIVHRFRNGHPELVVDRPWKRSQF